MSNFTRLSMGVKFGVRAPRSETITPVVTGTRFFFSFSGTVQARSEQLSDAPIAPRMMSIRLATPERPMSESADYWSAPWRRAHAPASVRDKMTVRVIWSKRVGM